MICARVRSLGQIPRICSRVRPLGQAPRSVPGPLLGQINSRAPARSNRLLLRSAPELLPGRHNSRAPARSDQFPSSCSVGSAPASISSRAPARASPTSPQTGGSAQDLIFSTLIGHLEKVFPGGENDMADVDLAATSSHPRTTGPPMWSTRHEEAGLTQVWGSQRSYGRPNTGKVDTPYLQAHASPQGRRAWWRGTTVCKTDVRPYRVPTSSYVRSAWSDGVRNIPHLWAFQLDCSCGNPVSSVPPQSSTVPAGLVSDLLSLSWLAELGGP
ncbi:hypothetical protein B296_00010516 [Ensete ventricosum]|uniref:Uncharacterized protein n=1 Tax=Ensete ventricosum TaxID=4639 RepID=A0A426Z995_ENSVE|nr:hypothetical protein B296_00010516 [Ensete ventricosum]